MKRRLPLLFMTTFAIATLSFNTQSVKADEVKDEAKYNAKMEELTASEADALETLYGVNRNISDVTFKSEELIATLSETNTKIKSQTDKIEELTKLMESRNEKLADQARVIQTSGKGANYIQFLLKSESINDFFQRASVVSNMVDANRTLFEEQKADRAEVQEIQLQTIADQEVQEAAAVELEALKGELEIIQSEKAVAVAALQAEQATLKEDREKYLEEKRKAEEEAARIKAEQEAARKAAEEAARKAAEEEAARIAAEEEAARIAEEEAARAAAEAAIQEPEAVEETVAPAPATPAAAPQSSVDSGSLISIAEQYLGVPYVWGGKSPSGFDCSGFVRYVYMQAGYGEIGTWTVPQENAGVQISVDQAQPGDLLFWGARGSTHHVAMYTGNGSYIEAPQAGDVVKYSSLSSYNYPSFAVRIK